MNKDHPPPDNPSAVCERKECSRHEAGHMAFVTLVSVRIEEPHLSKPPFTGFF